MADPMMVALAVVQGQMRELKEQQEAAREISRAADIKAQGRNQVVQMLFGFLNLALQLPCM